MNIYSRIKGPATCNDIVNEIIDDARSDAIFATLKNPSLRVAWPLGCIVTKSQHKQGHILSKCNTFEI